MHTMIGRPLDRLFPEANREELMDRVRRTSSGERFESVEIPIIGADGKSRTVLWNSATLYETDGTTVLSTIAQGQDITERKLAEEELALKNEELVTLNEDLTEKEEELRQNYEELSRAERILRENSELLASAEEIARLGSWDLDLVTNRLNWSDEVFRIFGLRPQEFGATYDAFLEAVHPEDRDAVDAAYSGSLLEGVDAYEIEHRVVRRDNGEERFVHEKCKHYRDETGTIIRSVGMVHDITERKQVETDLALKNEELVTLNEDLAEKEEELRQNLDELGRSERALRETTQYPGEPDRICERPDHRVGPGVPDHTV